MRFLEINEIWDWCAHLGVKLVDEALPAPDARLAQRTRCLYADGKRSGRESDLSRTAIAQLGDWDQTLLWITQAGIWPSTEDWPRYYAMRGRAGERRSLDVAPGHLFEPGDRELLVQFLTATMENGWDAFVLSAVAGHAGDTRVQVSHDEWIELQSLRPVSLSVPAV